MESRFQIIPDPARVISAYNSIYEVSNAWIQEMKLLESIGKELTDNGFVITSVKKEQRLFYCKMPPSTASLVFERNTGFWIVNLICDTEIIKTIYQNEKKYSNLNKLATSFIRNHNGTPLELLPANMKCYSNKYMISTPSAFSRFIASFKN